MLFYGSSDQRQKFCEIDHMLDIHEAVSRFSPSDTGLALVHIEEPGVLCGLRWFNDRFTERHSNGSWIRRGFGGPTRRNSPGSKSYALDQVAESRRALTR